MASNSGIEDNLTLAEIRKKLQLGDINNLDPSQKVGDREVNDVGPSDSCSVVSKVMSGVSFRSTSSVRSARAAVLAEKAALSVKRAKLYEIQRLEEEKFKLDQRKQLLELDSEIEATAAREVELLKFEEPEAVQPPRKLSVRDRVLAVESRVQEHVENTASEFVKKHDFSVNDHDDFEPHLPRQEEITRVKFEPPRVTIQPKQEDSCTDDLLKSLVAYNIRNSVPNQEVKCFNGDITAFLTFMKSFENVIGSKIEDEEEKLHYLYQYTSGKP